MLNIDDGEELPILGSVPSCSGMYAAFAHGSWGIYCIVAAMPAFSLCLSIGWYVAC
jgi:hypothetical protein